jgi:DNA-binding NarL/FixJ family response regulator
MTILQLVAEGKSNKDIASELVISENTVKIHIRNILEKLHLQNRIQAAVYAVSQGLVSDPPRS